MNLEELQAMSDDELNKLAARNVMGWAYRHMLGYKQDQYVVDEDDYVWVNNWNPTADMNDAFSLVERLEKDDFFFSMTSNTVNLHCSFGPCEKHGNPHHNGHGVEYEEESKNANKARMITIASILAKGE